MQRQLVRLIAIVAVLVGLSVPRQAAHAQPDGGSGQIVNGLETSGFPSVGALLTPNNPNTGRVRCSGTMIGCETFLTAAHCVCDSDGSECTGPLPPDPSGYIVFLQHAGFFEVNSITLRSDYVFPVADIALLKLGRPMDGVPPVPIDSAGPPSATSGIIVGFGNSGGGSSDFGLKRTGAVTTGTCGDPESDTTSVCWTFSAPVGPPGEDSNTCNGDSGGPLFVDYGSGLTVAGVTSGGDSADCLPQDLSFDARVATYSTWIQTEGGADLTNTSCGSLPQVGSAATTVVPFAGELSSANTDERHSFEVTAGTTVIRVALNAIDNAFSDYDLYVKAGSPPTTVDYDCAANGPNQYGYCEFSAPQTGSWHVLIDRVPGSIGTGRYQVTVTLFGTDCTQPDNDGLPCDDDNQCTENDTCQSGTCDGTAVSDGTQCDDDNECSGPDSCAAGSCVAALLSGTPCDDGSRCTLDDVCQNGLCLPGAAPALSCRQPFVAGKASLFVKDKSGGTDKLLWKWLKGESTEMDAFGDPTATSSYALCLYDESNGSPQLLIEKAINAGEGWAFKGDGYQYKDRKLVNGPVSNLLLRSGADGSAKIILRAKGSGLGLGSFVIDDLSSVLVQLLNGDQCWEAHYTGASNSPGQFRAKAD